MLQVKLTWKLCFHPNKWRETPFKVNTEALRSSPSETVSAAQTLPHRFTVVFLNTGEEPLGRIKMDAEFNLQESQALSGRVGSGSLFICIIQWKNPKWHNDGNKLSFIKSDFKIRVM